MLNKKKERELAYVVKIDNILPIEGAERVEQAVVGGWHIMVRKNQFKIGDYAIYFEIDSKVPEREPYMFLADKHFKIKTQKYFKGTVISQGLLMAFDDFKDDFGGSPSWLVNVTIMINNRKLIGKDPLEDPIFLTKELGITYAVEEDNARKGKVDPNAKYRSMTARHQKIFKKKWARWMMRREWGRKIMFFLFGKKKDNPRTFPTHFPFIHKTDEERCENLVNVVLGYERPLIVTEKLDGNIYGIKARYQDIYYLQIQELMYNRFL